MPNNEPALYATQGGGYATYSHGQYVWYEIPESFPEFCVGDSIPEEWSVVGINEAARRADDEDHMFDDDEYIASDDGWPNYQP